MKNFDLLLRSGKTIFWYKNLSLLLGTENINTIKGFIQRAQKQNLLEKIANGIYALHSYEFLELAASLRQKSYISLETVLQKEWIIFQDYSNTVTLISDNTLEKNIAGKVIQFSKIKDTILLNPLGIEYTGRYLIASKERAICDRIYLSSSYYFDNLSGVDFQKLEKIAMIYNKTTILHIKNSSKMLQVTKHREIMYHILRDIFSWEYASNLAFKWGTLCYFVHKLDRFSTDLDIDLVRNMKDENLFLIHIESILIKYGKIKEKIKKRYTFFFLLSYGETDMNIKVEINTRIWNENHYEIVNFFGIEMLVQDRSTLFANKLVALTDRSMVVNRDLYDTYFFFRNMFPINEAVIQERTGKNLKEYFIYLLDFIEKHVNRNNPLDGLGEVLDPKQKAFVKEKLYGELVWILQFQIQTRVNN